MSASTDQPTRYQPLLAVFVALGVGIVADRAFCLPFLGAICLVFAAGLGWFAGRRQGAASWLLALALAGLGAAWHHTRWYSFAPDDLGAFARAESRPIALEARVVSAPRLSPPREADAFETLASGEQSRVLLEAEALRDEQTWRSASGRATLWVEGRLEGLHAGDRVRVFGRIIRPPPALNPGGIDMAAHLRATRQMATLRADGPEAVQLLERGSRWLPRRWLDDLRAAGLRQLAAHGSPRNVELSSALLLGAREQIDPAQNQEFLVTGTIHLLSISGLHVGILAAMVLALERIGLLGLRAALLLAIAVTIVYAALADAEAPVVRAATLVVVLCVARLLGREALTLNNLALSALVVLALSPADLFRIGPQLSFLSTLALGWAAVALLRPREIDPLEKLLARSRPWPWRAAVATGRFLAHLTWLSLVVWSVTIPLVWSRFHVVSPGAIVLGTLLWLPVTLAMWAGFALLATGWIASSWAAALAWLCDAGLSVLDAAVQAVAHWPAAYFWAAGPPDWWLIGFYGGLAAWGLSKRVRSRRIAGRVAGLAWCVVGLAAALMPRTDDALTVTVLAVGHGSAATIEWPDGPMWVCDAGSLAAPRRAGDAVSGALWSRHRRHIDTLIISHADADHFNGAPALLERFSVGRVVVPPGFVDSDQPAVRELLARIAAQEIPIEEAAAGDVLRAISQGEALALHPPRAGGKGSDNARSLVLAVAWRGRAALLPGDLESPGLETLLAAPPRDVSLLVAPHHGSARSDVPGLTSWCGPEVVAISGGFHADVRRVSAAYRALGVEVWHTSRCGAVTWRVSRDGAESTTPFLDER